MSKDYKQYNSTVKSVTVACEQIAHGHHVSDGDMNALKHAIEDLVSVYNVHLTPDNALELKEF
jgi:hypothetical protein